MSNEHDSFEMYFRSSILNKASVCEFYIEIIIAFTLTKNHDRANVLKLILLNQSSISFQYKIEAYKLIMEKYHKDLLDENVLTELRDLRKIRNKVAHYSTAGTEDAKKDAEHQRLRLTEFEGLKVKHEFYKYSECASMIDKFQGTADKLHNLSKKLMNNLNK